MAIKANKKVVLVKIEPTPGVDANPVPATDAIEVLNLRVTTLSQRMADRNVAKPYFGHNGQIQVGATMILEYDIEIAGAGAVDSAPGYAAVLSACAMSETITPTTGPVTYNVVSDAEEYVTQTFYYEDQLRVMLYGGGSWEIRFSEGAVPLLHLRFEGIYGGVSTAAPGTPDLSAFQKALAMTKANTTFSLHGYAAPLSSLTISQNNRHVYKNRPNSERMHFTDRQSTGSVVIEMPKFAVKDFITICEQETLGALAMVHGTTAGNKVLIDAPTVQLVYQGESEQDNMVMLSMNMLLVSGASGNDEFTFKTQ